MCHISRNVSLLATPASVEATPVIGSIRGSKSIPSRTSSFRRIAKTARVNLNKYWGLLSQKPVKSSTTPAMMMNFDHSAEMEENQLNEMMEALANAEEQNSINSQIECDSSPEPQPRRMFVRQNALRSSSYSVSSYGSSSSTSSRDSFYF